MRDPAMAHWRDLVARRAERESHRLSEDVIDELASHLAEAETSALEQGIPAPEARRRTLEILNAASFLALGPRAPAPHNARPRRATGLLRDLRLAFRHLRQSPGFTATALMTLAIGIGATAAMFTLVHAVLLASLPVAHAERLYKLGDEYRCCPTETLQGNWSIFSYPFYLEIRDHVPAFEAVAAMDTLRPDVSVRRSGGVDAAEAFTGEFVSGNYFTTLGVDPSAGRLLDRTDDRIGAPPVAVASYAASQKAGLDRAAVGQPLTISGVTVTLIGIAPPGFFGDRLESHPPDFWMPLSLEPTFMRENSLLETRTAGWLYIAGRLRPNESAAGVQAQLTAALRNYLREPANLTRDADRANVDRQTIRLVPGGSGNNAMKRDYEQGLYLLLAVSASVLLIACANLANLLLVRCAAQRMSMAVELAMGASVWQLVRRQLAEAFLLSLAGGALGLMTAVAISRVIVLMAFRGASAVPIATWPSLPVLVFTCGVSLLTGALFGAGPAWLAAHGDPADALRGSARVVGDGGRFQRMLVVLQAAASLVLITVAGLMSRSLSNLGHQPYGFQPEGRLVVQIDPQSAGYTQTRLETLYRRLDDRLSRVPGVISESLSLYTAQQADGIWGARIYLDAGKGPFPAVWDRVGPRYFETIGTPIVRGRSLGERDPADTRLVAVVNATFAARYFPGQDAIGRHFGKYETGHANDFEIVGVTEDAKYVDATRPVAPMFFVPLSQQVKYSGGIFNQIEEASRYIGSIELFVRGAPDAIQPAVRAALADVDPNLAPKSIASFPELIRITGRQRTLTAALSDAFGAVALVLAAIGLYGVTAYRVTRRKTEIGLRIALGATRAQIAAMVIRGAVSQTGVGLLVGVPFALIAARALRTQLFGVSPFDLSILALSAGLVAACSVIASVWPARRASGFAPVEMLRRS
jgi:predicted permease